MVARAASVLFLILLVCVFHLRSWSIVTPRYLIAVDSSMSTPLNGSGLSKLSLATFNLRPLASIQAAILSRSVLGLPPEPMYSGELV